MCFPRSFNLVNSNEYSSVRSFVATLYESRVIYISQLLKIKFPKTKLTNQHLQQIFIICFNFQVIQMYQHKIMFIKQMPYLDYCCEISLVFFSWNNNFFLVNSSQSLYTPLYRKTHTATLLNSQIQTKRPLSPHHYRIPSKQISTKNAKK